MPPSGIASRELTARLTTICSIWPRPASTGRRPPTSSVRSSMPSPSVTASRPSAARTASATSIGSTATTSCREKTSSWWVSSAARRAASSISAIESSGPRPSASASSRAKSRVVEDHREQVVEVVRDAAGQLPHRLHPAGAVEAQLELADPRVLGGGGEDVAERPHELELLLGEDPGRGAERDDRAHGPLGVADPDAEAVAPPCRASSPPGGIAPALTSRTPGWPRGSR